MGCRNLIARGSLWIMCCGSSNKSRACVQLHRADYTLNFAGGIRRLVKEAAVRKKKQWKGGKNENVIILRRKGRENL